MGGLDVIGEYCGLSRAASGQSARNRNKETYEEKQQHEKRRNFPKEIERDKLEIDQQKKNEQIDVEQEDDHGAASRPCGDGASTNAQINASGHSTKPQMRVTQPATSTASAQGWLRFFAI
jgi:hypothetical protein